MFYPIYLECEIKCIGAGKNPLVWPSMLSRGFSCRDSSKVQGAFRHGCLVTRYHDSKSMVSVFLRTVLPDDLLMPIVSSAQSNFKYIRTSHSISLFNIYHEPCGNGMSHILKFNGRVVSLYLSDDILKKGSYCLPFLLQLWHFSSDVLVISVCVRLCYVSISVCNFVYMANTFQGSYW